MLPKHHKTSFFLKAGIFNNLSSFAQLEKRISELPTTVEEGDAFEVFAEAYFFTQKIEQAEEVWPFKCIPARIKENLSLGTNQKDMGVDGVFKTVSGEFNAYQAKFRTERKSITWSELSTFMGLTDKVNQRVLFTNSNDITSVINERTGFYCIRGNDLDRLGRNDFESILKWLKSGVLEIERKTPQPHQNEAIKDILIALKHEDRATTLMACGTGKTLIALWVSEQMDCQNILVLLPSLTLVRQTLHEWLKETNWQHLSYLCVCSDPTVAGKELDNIIVNQSDLDFAVTTESKTVKQFLSQSDKGIKIVFSTYQSAHIVAEAMDNNYRFDLGIFDEAHKTAGREGKKFGFALKDDNLRIKKRLFLTATPRHHNINKKNEEGDFDLVYSMDNPDVYGKVTHELSFAKAARQDIICNYKVIISVVTSEQVNKEMLKRGEVLINGDVVNAQQVANQIAFKEAIDKYNIRRIFTFHRSVATAKSFTGKGSEGIRTPLPEFNTFHVNGSMPTAVREGIMGEFKNSDNSVISNARCLTEGVDLPAVDMVAFMSPKKSKVDIVQATGRAMRKDPHNPDKVLGYILVPLYLEITTGERIEDAVAKADFEEVWNVLQALQEEDEVLADIIRQMSEDKGRYGKYKGDGFGDKVETLGVNISLKTLQKAITAICIERLGLTWDEQYGRLIKYRERFGHCNVSRTWTEDVQLATWVNDQRWKYRKGKLSNNRIKRLNDIGFVWELHKSNWEEMFEALNEYKENHGDCNVPFDWLENNKLGIWVRTQRRKYLNKKLSKDRIKRLECIGFVWNPFESSWEELFNVLEEYKENHGGCNVPQNWVENNLKLGIWVSTQRSKYLSKKLSEDHIKRLEDIDFVWNTIESSWEEMFNALKEYKKNHGDCNVPRNWKEDEQLADWAHSQRTRKEKLSEDRIKRLNDIGFVWTPHEASWEENFDKLKKYKERFGHCNVSRNWSEDEQLARWVSWQRHTYGNGELSEDRVNRLEDIDFVWEPDESSWEENFDKLKKYKERFGHCNVPKKWLEDKSLGSWVERQRQNYESRKLSEDNAKRLEDIGFVWAPHEASWEENFDKLKKYKERFGHCNVPKKWSEDKSLGKWVSWQREAYIKGKLDKYRINRLEDISFVWKQIESQWEEKFNVLKEYKENHGDCNVPRNLVVNDLKLGSWVHSQRIRKEILGKDRIKRLEDLGFEWNIRKR
jgi:superfamily II DNA or RNA helicase